MDLSKAIEFAQLLNAAYAIQPDDLTSAAGQQVTAGGRAYTVLSSIYANDLATDMNPEGGNNRVSIGLICQANGTGEVAIAIRGTEGIWEWIHDLQFLLVPCPIVAASGNTEDGFTAMYRSLRTGVDAGSPTVAQSLATLAANPPITSVTICGHSLGGALATLVAFDVAVNSAFREPTVYTYASPRTGDSSFANTFNHVMKNSFRIASRMDVVPHVPLPPLYEHVLTSYELNPVQLLPLPPKVLVKWDLQCQHSLDTYLYLLSLRAGGTVLPLDPQCVP